MGEAKGVLQGRRTACTVALHFPHFRPLFPKNLLRFDLDAAHYDEFASETGPHGSGPSVTGGSTHGDSYGGFDGGAEEEEEEDFAFGGTLDMGPGAGRGGRGRGGGGGAGGVLDLLGMDMAGEEVWEGVGRCGGRSLSRG